MRTDLRPGDRDGLISMTVEEHTGTGRAIGLQLFNGPFVTVDGRRRRIPDCGERLMVWLALRRDGVDRSLTAGTLWPLVDDRRAAGNLRSALWRLRGAGLDLVEADNTSLALRESVTVDVRLAADWAQRVLARTARAEDVVVVPWFAGSMMLLSAGTTTG